MSESWCFTVGKALLWYIYSTNNIVPQDFCDQVKQDLKEIMRGLGLQMLTTQILILPEKFQWQLQVSEDEGSVVIEAIDEEVLAMGLNNQIAGGTRIHEQLLTFTIRNSQLH